jgi:hypothetical protein
MSSHDIKNPTEEVDMRHVMEASNPDDHLLERTLGEHPFPDYGPVVSVNRPLRTRWTILFLAAMNFIMTNGTKGFQVFLYICTAFCMMLDMVYF